MAERREHYDVILIQPGIVWVYDAFEHLGLAYLAAALRNAGLSVKIIDAVLLEMRMSELYEELDRYDVGVLGVTLVSHGYLVTTRFLEQYRHRHPETRVVAGGHFATFAAHKIFGHTDVFDAIVLGEGELSFVEYCRAVAGGVRDPQIPDVAVADRPVERSMTRITQMDALPFPARDNLQLALRKGAIASITASRGCYARCAFCTVPSFYQARNGPRWLGRSIENVIEELRDLHARFALSHFMFVDDNFMGPGRRGRERALEFADAYARSGLPMTFHIDLRATDVNEEVMAGLVRVGLKSVFIGIESVSDDDLVTYRKDLRADANWNAVRIIRKFNLQRTLSMIMFNPTTTEAAIRANCQFLRLSDYYPRNPIMILNVYEGTAHSREFASRLSGPFWNYRFEFDRQSVAEIHREALDFCRSSVPLERELSRREDGAGDARNELFRLRLGCLEDLATNINRQSAVSIRERWNSRLAALQREVSHDRRFVEEKAAYKTIRLFDEPNEEMEQEPPMLPADVPSPVSATIGAAPPPPR